jgi:hypothetical protein
MFITRLHLFYSLFQFFNVVKLLINVQPAFFPIFAVRACSEASGLALDALRDHSAVVPDPGVTFLVSESVFLANCKPLYRDQTLHQGLFILGVVANQTQTEWN